MDAIYARQSIDKKGSLSIEGQIELCRKFTVDDALVFSDKGFSGKNTKRPAFGELMEAVEAGRVKKIVVYRLDRFSRSLADFSQIWELLRKNDVEFLSVNEQFDTSSPMGRAMLNIVMTFAQLERETTAERVRDNYHHRVSLGAWPGGPAPYGYALSKAELDGRKVSSLIADENAKTVLRIFEEYVRSETSLRALAKTLTEQGIHGPKREAWDNVTLSRILRNPVYVQADEAVYCYYLAQGIQILTACTCNLLRRNIRPKHGWSLRPDIDAQRLCTGPFDLPDQKAKLFSLGIKRSNYCHCTHFTVLSVLWCACPIPRSPISRTPVQ